MDSDTPRTDVAEWRTSFANERVVHADFVRQLERELSAMRKQRDSLDEECREATASWNREANETLDLYRELAAMQKQRDEARVRAAAEGANTASLLHTLALIREAGKWQKEMLSELPGAVKAMREQRDIARRLYCALLDGIKDAVGPREKEGGGA